MPRITLSQVQSLDDIIMTDAFEFLLGNVPGGGNTQNLTLLCRSAVVAGNSNEAQEVALHGYVRKFRGKKMFPRTLAVTYSETVNFEAHRILRNWLEYCAGTSSGNSQGYSNDYSVTAEMRIYDTTGALVDTTTYYKVFPQEIQDVQTQGDSGTPLEVSATFNYDYQESSNTETT